STLNGCLCEIVEDPNVNLGDTIQCRQAGCETHWYHLQCLELEQAPVRWVCEACKASG
ncbi:hypothetical protein L208DRAFT_1017022, partial [Tricholoma matsutake]